MNTHLSKQAKVVSEESIGAAAAGATTMQSVLKLVRHSPASQTLQQLRFIHFLLITISVPVTRQIRTLNPYNSFVILASLP